MRKFLAAVTSMKKLETTIENKNKMILQ